MHRRFLKLLILSRACSVGTARAEEPVSITSEQFGPLHQLSTPQPGESRWRDIPWLIDLHAARQKAAAEGKSILVLSGGGATGMGACGSAGRSVGRAPRKGTEETVRLVQENFVAVSASNDEQRRAILHPPSKMRDWTLSDRTRSHG